MTTLIMQTTCVEPASCRDTNKNQKGTNTTRDINSISGLRFHHANHMVVDPIGCRNINKTRRTIRTEGWTNTTQYELKLICGRCFHLNPNHAPHHTHNTNFGFIVQVTRVETISCSDFTKPTGQVGPKEGPTQYTYKIESDLRALLIHLLSHYALHLRPC